MVHQPRWEVTVHAIPRPLRHVIKTKVVEEALPAMRSWLMANAHSLEREGGHGIVFRFDELNDAMLFEEHASPEWRTIRAD
jgi:hypothetical protein